MKRILVLLLSVILLSACSKDDDNKIVYNEQGLGYVTNIESVRYGVAGRWENQDDASIISFDADDVYQSGSEFFLAGWGKIGFLMKTEMAIEVFHVEGLEIVLFTKIK